MGRGQGKETRGGEGRKTLKKNLKGTEKMSNKGDKSGAGGWNKNPA